MNVCYPKVLFVTPCAFNHTTGGGITFSNLFTGWPKDNIATIHNDVVPVTTDVCEKYYFLTRKEIRKLGITTYHDVVASTENGSPEDLVNNRKINLFRVLKFIKGIVFGDAVPEKVTITEELEAWITRFKPDVLYTILGSNSFMELVERIRVQFRLPLVVHMMDNWPAAIYRGGLLSWFQRRKMQRLLAHLFSVAETRLSICDYMSQDYQAMYGVPLLSFQNAVHTDRWSHLAKRDLAIGPSIRLLYIGSIFPNAQLQSLIDCCQAVVELRQRGIPITFDIYSPSFLSEQYRDRLVIDASISLKDTIIDDTRFFEELSKADILLLPVNFDKATVRYINYSMPTKVPAYLVSGTPILVYGPESVAQVRYAEQREWGHVVSQQGVRHLMDGILELVNNINLRMELSSTARAVAASNHNVKKVRSRFQSVLCNATQ